MKTFAELFVTEPDLKELVVDGLSVIKGIQPPNKTITDCVFKGPLVFDRVDLGNKIQFINCKFEQGLEFDECYCDRVKAFDRRTLHFLNCSFEDVSFKQCDLQGGITISDSSIGKLTMANCKLENGVTISFNNNGNRTEAINLETCSFAGAFVLQGNENLTIEHVNLIGGNGASGAMTFVGGTIKTLSLEENFIDTNILFQRCQIENMQFTRYESVGGLSFMACPTVQGGIFTAENSDFGTAKFMGFDFSKFRSLLLTESTLAKIAWVSCKWFDDDHLTGTSTGNEYHQKRQVYKQLKQAAESQGDGVQAREFHAREMEAFRREVTSTKPFFATERLVLLLRLSNGFGLNWSRPLGLLIVITTLFYALMLVSYPSLIDITGDKSVADTSLMVTFFDRSEILAQMFNPFHNLSDMVNGPIPTSIYWLDGIHRLIAAFLLIQFALALGKALQMFSASYSDTLAKKH